MRSDEHPQHNSDLAGRIVFSDLIDSCPNLALADALGQQDDGRAAIRRDSLLGNTVKTDLVFTEGAPEATYDSGYVESLESDIVRVLSLVDA